MKGARSIILHKNFEKRYAKLPEKLKKAFKVRKDLFLENPDDPRLAIHALHGAYKGYESFNVTGDVRVVFKELQKAVFIFADIGTHDELYS